VSPELGYVALLFALFVVPKTLQRLRIPSAITSFLLGAGAGAAGLFAGDPTLGLLAMLGISGLFLFAGLEVEGKDLRRGAALVAQHLAVNAAMLYLATRGFMAAFDLAWRPAALVSLALLTPSTGFILDSLHAWGLDERQRFWTRTKAIATELLALLVLLVVLQSTTAVRLALTTGALVALVLLIPLVMRTFAAAVAPWAPRSEFTFLVMLAAIAAFVTKKLGVYYLVGAFLVGVGARRFRDRLPALSSERMLHAVEVFAAFFAPFYFFSAGAHLRAEQLGLASLLTGAAYLAVFVPLRLAVVLLHRRIALGEGFEEGRPVATALLPTLVFSLVIAELAAERFEVPAHLVGGIVLYALGNTVVPALALKGAPAFDAPSLDPDASAPGEAERGAATAPPAP
jgi:Kef-type K+ transport system membrane component KefB